VIYSSILEREAAISPKYHVKVKVERNISLPRSSFNPRTVHVEYVMGREPPKYCYFLEIFVFH
jgi:hypothetical protein